MGRRPQGHGGSTDSSREAGIGNEVVGGLCHAERVDIESTRAGLGLAVARTASPTYASREIPSPWRRRPDFMHVTGKPQLVAILDTNAIAAACCMEAGSGQRSLVTRVVLTGRVPCFIAEHVPGEMDEHLDRIAGDLGVEMGAARVAWQGQIAPLLRVVDLPIGEYLRPEIAGIRQPPPAGDPDDWASSALAALLGPAAIITRDNVFARLGYANEATDWTVTATTLRRAAALECEQIDRAFFTTMSARLTGAGVGGLVNLTRRHPWMVPVAVGLGVIAVQRIGWAKADPRARAALLLEQLYAHMHRITDDMAEFTELRRGLVTVHDPPWRTESVTERCARTLARSGEPLALGELRDVMNLTGGEPVSAAALRRIMGAHPAFVRLPGDRYQVGRAIQAT